MRNTEILFLSAAFLVVASVTIPRFVIEKNRTEQIEKIYTIYNEFQEAANLMVQKEKSIEIENSKDAYRFLRQYVQTAACDDCFAEKYTSANGNEDSFSCRGITEKTNGAAVCLIPSSPAVPVTVYIDTNGNKPPNIGGKDIFRFQIYKQGKIDEGVNPNDPLIKAQTLNQMRGAEAQSCTASPFGHGCFAKLVNNKWSLK